MRERLKNERANAGSPALTVSPKDPRFAQLEAEIAELVAAFLYDYLKKQRKEKEGVAIAHDEPE